MKSDRGLRLKQKPKAQRWRIGLIWGFIFALGIINFGCDKGDDIDPNEYYVKYVFNSSSIHIGGKIDVTITAEDNEAKTFVVYQRQRWETTIGPVKKGFLASLQAVAASTNQSLSAEIQVSENDSPFALKEIDDSDERRDNIQVSYTIDY